jgi:hypothetical protein
MISRRIRAATVLAAGAAAIGVGLSAASAQDCFVTNRAIQGAFGAAHSSQWQLIDMNAILVGFGACPALVTQVDAAMAARGFPIVVVTRSNKTLPDNGHGIQHLDDPGGYFDTAVNAANAGFLAGVCG